MGISQEQHPSDPAASYWHMDRRVPIALILALGTQLVIGAVYFGVLTERIKSNAATIAKFERDYRNIPTQLAVLEAIMTSVDLRLQQLSSGVEKHENRFHDIGVQIP